MSEDSFLVFSIKVFVVFVMCCAVMPALLLATAFLVQLSEIVLGG